MAGAAEWTSERPSPMVAGLTAAFARRPQPIAAARETSAVKLLRTMKVFRQDTAACQPVERPDATFRKLSEDEIRQQGDVPDDIFQRQQQRLARFGRSYCHGAFVDGRLAAFAWLLPHDAMKRDAPHILGGRPGQAEITAAETLPDFRGRNLHSYVIKNLFVVGRETGIHTVLFKTFPTNAAALRSFEKVGADYVGTTYMVYVPGVASPVVWPRHFA